MRTVIARQVGITLSVTEIVDGKDLYFIGAVAFVQGPQNISSNTAITIDSDLQCHYCYLLLRNRRLNGGKTAWLFGSDISTLTSGIFSSYATVR